MNTEGCISLSYVRDDALSFHPADNSHTNLSSKLVGPDSASYHPRIHSANSGIHERWIRSHARFP